VLEFIQTRSNIVNFPSYYD